MSFRVLLLESSRLHSASLKTRLESIGAHVVLVQSKDALASITGEDYDLAVTDCVLPGYDGHQHFEVLRRSKKPVWLWSDDQELLGDPTLQAALGIEKAFRKLNRADLIHDCEILCKRASAAAEAPKNFLLVEDSPTVRSYVRHVLQDRFPSSKISEAEDGKAAIALMKTSKIDLIVTDLQMPGMDGASFVQVLRSNAVLAKKPIVILSGMITAKVREEMTGLPKLCLLPKPASPEALGDAISRLLGSAEMNV